MRCDVWWSHAEDVLDALWRRVESPDALLQEAYEAIVRLIPVRGGVLYHFTDPSRGFDPIAGSLAPVFDDVDPALLRPENDPSHRPMVRLKPRPRVVAATRELVPGEFRSSPAYRDIYRKHGIEHIVCCWLDGKRPFEPGMLGMMLARDEGLGRFEEHHLDLLREALPLLTAAAHRSRDRATQRRPPHVLVGLHGDVREVTPEAEEALAAVGLRPDELAERLAGEIRRWRELRSARDAGGLATATRMLHAIERRGRALFIQVTEREDGAVELALLDEARTVRIEELREVHGLTPAEIAVLQALAFGMSNAEVAAFLCVHVDTVKSHVRRLLRKLGLSSRLQAGLMMQRVLWDTP